MKTNRIALPAFLASVISIVLFSTAHAQFPEDALRYSSTGIGIGARAIGMGGAYIGVADDYSATFWNPAGLAQMRRLEFTGGLANTSYSNDASFFGNSATATNSATTLNDLGFVFPFPTDRGSLVVSAGYNRTNDFTSALSFDGFNNQSSILPYLFDPDVRYDIPYGVGLEDVNEHINVTKNVNQQGDVRESGGMGNWAFAGAIDVQKDLSFGLTVNVLSGSYTYTRNYTEADTKNLYSDPRPVVPIDSAYLKFNNFYYNSTLTSDVSGVNAKFGMMYRFEDVARIGVTIQTPTTISVHENYSDEGWSTFDDGYIPVDSGGTVYNHLAYDAYNDYSVETPWVFGAGASYSPFDGLLLSGALEYTDWTQIQWADNSDLEQENIALKKNFRATTNYSVGGEFEIPKTELRVRAGYAYKPSPFAGDPSSYAQKTVTAGLGVLLQDDVMFDLAAAFGSTKAYDNNYGPAASNLSRTDESISTTNVYFTISYRF
ncbi:MAG TPA: outer membrane protein transport protein [Bacteroidota bacterium]|nr:outer membrane protein transport protein [Bacteroidota bacterium]